MYKCNFKMFYSYFIPYRANLSLRPLGNLFGFHGYIREYPFLICWRSWELLIIFKNHCGSFCKWRHILIKPGQEPELQNLSPGSHLEQFPPLMFMDVLIWSPGSGPSLNKTISDSYHSFHFMIIINNNP